LSFFNISPLAIQKALCYIVLEIEKHLVFTKIDRRSFTMKHLGLFAAGVLFGTAGLKILSSKDAKKVYSHTTAAVLRAKDCVMQAVTNVREDAEDVYADAKDINERRAAEEDAEVIEDASEEKADEE